MGFFDKVGGFMQGASEAMMDKARRSDDPELVSKYLKWFDQTVEVGNIEMLETMLREEKYRVGLDWENDYKRQEKICKKLEVLYKQRNEQVAKEKKAFEQWLSKADADALELGLAQGKYQIRYDGDNDQSRKARLEKKLRPLQEKRKEEIARDGRARMEQLFRDYLNKAEAEIYKSYYVFSDFKKELDCLTGFQKRILQEQYGEQVKELLNKPSGELSETLANYAWQVNKKKLIAGKSLIILMLSERQATGELKATLTESLSKMEEAVFQNAYSPYIEESDLNLSADELLEMGNIARNSGDPSKAVAYYNIAAKSGNPEAMARLGTAFLYSLGVAGNNDKAFYWLVEASKKKSPEGLYGIGVCYQWGYGVKADPQKAIILYKESFSLGCSAGLYGLGCYYQADGADKDLGEAFKWHLRAAKKGCLSGMVETYINYGNGKGIDVDNDAASQWLTRLSEAASQNDSSLDLTAHTAFNYLGRAFTNGWPGTGGADNERALLWFKKGADIGACASKAWLIDFDKHESRNQILRELEAVNYSWALHQLGDYYGSGTGLPKDEVLSRYYYLKAAKYGDADSQYKVGMAYLEGRLGIPQNFEEAMKWLKMATDKGSAEAKTEFEKCVETKRAENERSAKADIQARKDAELKKKSKLDSQVSELMKQLKLCNEKIDNAASEKEENAAIAEKEEVQGKIDSLKARIGKIDEHINQIDMEFVSVEGAVYDEEKDVGAGRDEDENTEDPFGEILRILGKEISSYTEESCKNDEKSQYESVCATCGDTISFGEKALADGEAACPYCGEKLIFNVAYTQEELCDLLAKGIATIYLCGESFNIPANTGVVTFIGINHPSVRFSEDTVDSRSAFLGVEFNSADFVRIANATQNPEEAIIWWMKAAEIGDSEAQIELAKCYENGVGVEKSPDDAVKWYKAAAEQGNPKAQNILGNCYKNGYGVEQDYALAAEWYQKAAEHEVLAAQNSLGILFWTGNGVEQSYEEANRWFLRAAEQGYVWAQGNIGTSYRDGQGVEKNRDKAIEWLQKAVAQGHDSAKKDLIGLAPELFELSDVIPHAIGGAENLRDNSDSIIIRRSFDNGGVCTRTDIHIKVRDRHKVNTDMLRVFNISADVERNFSNRLVKVDIFKEGFFRSLRKALSDEYISFGDEYYKEEVVDDGHGTIKIADVTANVEESIRKAFPDQIYES